MGRLVVLEGAKLNLADVSILLGGGNATEVDMLMQIFAGFGARQLRRADDAQQIKAMLDQEALDLVILDSRIGVEGSMEMIRGLRRMTSENRVTPVLLTAANARPSLVREAREAGVNYVVAKPLTPRVLFDRLVWVVKDHRPFVECESYVGPCRRARALGPPAGSSGRREGDLPPEVGDASTPNLTQDDIDSMMFPVRKSK